MINKVLIATAWSPTKSGCFPEYAKGISTALSEDIDTELYITSSIVDEKFESIVRSMAEAQYYAMFKGFTHILNVEADRLIPEGIIKTGISHDKDVLLFTPISRRKTEPDIREFNDELCKELNPGTNSINGWGTMLVKVDTLRVVPFEEGYHGNFCWPDVMWFKKLKMSKIDIWVDRIHTVKLLEPAAATPGASFAPGLGDYVDKQLEGLKCHSH